MDGLFSLLIFAGLFYFMMRFGCGAHTVNGKSQSEKDNSEANHIDPVCGMKVDPNKGYGLMYEERLYRFCSRKCLDQFEARPHDYNHSNQDKGEPS